MEAPLLDLMNELFARAYHSVSATVLDAEPYAVPEDKELLALLQSVADQDRRYARAYAGLLDARDIAPQPGAYAYWYRDLNYLSVPYLGTVLVEALQKDLDLVRQAIEAWPKDKAQAGFDLLQAIRGEREAAIGKLEKASRQAREREDASYVQEREDAARLRAAWQAKQKGEEPPPPAARKPAPKKPAAPTPGVAAAPAPAVLDPDEEGISKKEKARRQILKMRAKKAGAAAPAAPAAPAPAAAPAADDIPDPDEPGISKKEKARRQILKMRAKKAGAAAPAAPAAPAPAAADPAPAHPDIPDPNEPGISPKEKARRHVLRKRAQKAGTAAAPSAKVEPAKVEPAKVEPAKAAPVPEAVADEIPDPDEPGISPKEKARRQVLRMRAKQKRGE